jgi:hypothetical protein
MKRSDYISKSLAPTDPFDLWEMAHLLNHDWSDPFQVDLQFSTDIQSALTAKEQRWGLRGVPIRTLTTTVEAWNPREGQVLSNWLNRAAQARSLVPLHSDATVLTIPAPAGSSTLFCDTKFRRFFPGGRVAVFIPGGRLCELFELADVSFVSDSQLTLRTPLVHAFSAGSRIVPLLEVQIVSSEMGDISNDFVREITVNFIETVGSAQLPLSSNLGEAPDEFQSYEGLPILLNGLDFGQNLQWGFDRIVSETSSGIATVQTLFGNRPRATFSLAYRSLNREDAWNQIRFFESRAGRLFPFWVVSPTTNLTLHGVVNESLITVPSAGIESDWNFQTYVAIVMKTGVVHIRAIDDVFRGGGNDILTLSEPIPGLTAEKVKRITTAFKCRLNSDSVTEVWQTTSVLDLKFTVVELLEDRNVDVEGMGMSSFALLDALFIQAAVNAFRLTPPENGDDYYRWELMPSRWSMRLFARGDGDYGDSSNARQSIIPSAYTAGDWVEGKFDNGANCIAGRRNVWIEGALDRPTEAWTIELHFKPASPISSSLAEPQTLISKWNKSVFEEGSWDLDGIELFFFPEDGRLVFYHVKGTQYGLLASTASSWSADWHHVAIVKTATHLYLYINGTLDVALEWDQTFDEGHVTDLEIGQRWWDGTGAFVGVVDEVRVSNVARTGFTTGAPYTYTDNTIVLLHLDEEEGYVAENDVPPPSGAPGFTDGNIANQMFLFNGTNHSLNFGNSTLLQMAPEGTEYPVDLSLSVWIRRGRSGVTETLISKWSIEQHQFRLQLDASNRVKFEFSSVMGDEVTLSSDPVPMDGNFHLVTVIWGENRDKGRPSIFIDGEETLEYVGDRPSVEWPLNYFTEDNGPELIVGRDDIGSGTEEGATDYSHFKGEMGMICLWTARLFPNDVKRMWLHQWGNISAGQGPGIYGDRFAIGDPFRFWSEEQKRWFERRAQGEWEAKDTFLVEYRNNEWVYIIPDTGFITYDKSMVWLTRFYPREWFELYGHLATAI